MWTPSTSKRQTHRQGTSVLEPKYCHTCSGRNGVVFEERRSKECSFTPRRHDKEDGPVPPEPFGPMGVSDDVFIASRRR